MKPQPPVDVPIPIPAYVYDLARVREAYSSLRQALPEPAIIYYSLKANPHPAIVRTLVALGCRAEISSSGELAAALAGTAATAELLYTGPGKSDDEVATALASGVRWFSVDSPAGLEQVGRLAGSTATAARCLLRINSASGGGHGLTMSGAASPFGADASWVSDEPDRFRDGVAGFHFFQGTNVDDTEVLLQQFDHALRTARQLSDRLGIAPEIIDLGGGFGAPFARAGALPDLRGFASQLAQLLDEQAPSWRDGSPTIAFESGRFLSGTCGSLMTRVADVKRSYGRTVVVLQSGINHLGGASGLRRLPPIVPDVLRARQPTDECVDDVLVAGPLCTPLDAWARSATMPAVEIGDLVSIPNVGAYGLTASLVAFLSHPAPYEVVVDDGRIVEVSRLVMERQPVRIPEGGEASWTPSSSSS